MLNLQGKLLKIATNDIIHIHTSNEFEYKQKYLSDMKILSQF